MRTVSWCRKIGVIGRLVLLVSTLVAVTGCGGDTVERPVDSVPRATALAPLEVVELLRGGGYVLYVRHATTDHSEHDDYGHPLSDCSHQRNLTPEGREQARSIGKWLRQLRIRVGVVLSSEYCRTRETALLAFGRARVVEALTGLAEQDKPDRARRVRVLRALLGRRPGAGTNTVIVGHIKNLEAATSLSIDEGETAVFRPLGGGRFQHVASFPAEVWPQLVEAEASR